MPLNLKPFIIIATFSAVVVVGFVLFRFLPRTLDIRTVDLRNLTPARDLKGTWEGTITFTESNNQSGSNYCTHGYLMRMVIDNLTETEISGTLSFKFQSIKGSCSSNETAIWSPATAFTAGISGSRITHLDLGSTQGVFSGSLTSDTITLNQTTLGSYDTKYSHGTYVVKTPVNLLRQH